MDAGLLAQFVANGLMLGMMYALVAVGFTLFFGVLDIIKFSHGDVLTVGTFAGFSTYLGMQAIGASNPWLQIAGVLLVSRMLRRTGRTGLAIFVLMVGLRPTSKTPSSSA